MFSDWKMYYGKSYASAADEATALKNFKASLKAVQSVNGQDSASFWASANE